MCFVYNHTPIGELNALVQLSLFYSKKLFPVIVGLILTGEREDKMESYRKIPRLTPVGYFIKKGRLVVCLLTKILDLSLKNKHYY